MFRDVKETRALPSFDVSSICVDKAFPVETMVRDVGETSALPSSGVSSTCIDKAFPVETKSIDVGETRALPSSSVYSEETNFKELKPRESTNFFGHILPITPTLIGECPLICHSLPDSSTFVRENVSSTCIDKALSAETMIVDAEARACPSSG
ncbi:hypothetical protein PanWU01x14_075240 [Parasponia andersonii]|uniref:Uncharacterized protein n=1 Tax=Parasponia andersonii TaxID=3476 RepID=A0A2P5DCS7_PARAD|nr:hypothetical protein PanWU01x14_075240 [Parasponia andersonii]